LEESVEYLIIRRTYIPPKKNARLKEVNKSMLNLELRQEQDPRRYQNIYIVSEEGVCPVDSLHEDFITNCAKLILQILINPQLVETCMVYFQDKFIGTLERFMDTLKDVSTKMRYKSRNVLSKIHGRITERKIDIRRNYYEADHLGVVLDAINKIAEPVFKVAHNPDSGSFLYIFPKADHQRTVRNP
jgi:hypothetical protein